MMNLIRAKVADSQFKLSKKEEQKGYALLRREVGRRVARGSRDVHVGSSPGRRVRSFASEILGNAVTIKHPGLDTGTGPCDIAIIKISSLHCEYGMSFDKLTFENVNSSSVLVGSDTSGVVSVGSESTTLRISSIGIAVESVLSSEHSATSVT